MGQPCPYGYCNVFLVGRAISANRVDNDSGLVKNRLDSFALDKLGDALNQYALTIWCNIFQWFRFPNSRERISI